MTLRIQSQRILHFTASALAVVAQRLPFLKHLAPLLSSPVSLRLATPLTVSFVGTHSLSGQTVSVFPFGLSENPAFTKVGDEFTWNFNTESDTVVGIARSYTVTGDLAALGVTYEYGIPIEGRPDFPGGTLRGTPTEAGRYFIDIIGWRELNESGAQTPLFTLEVVVEDDRPPSPFRDWREQKWNMTDAGNEEISGPQADPDGDGLPNVLEYFLNLSPTRATNMPGAIITDPENPENFLYTLPRRQQATDVIFKFQRNPSLNPDDWTDIVTGPQIDSPYDIIEDAGTITLRFPKNGTEFIRLVVSL